MKNIENVLICGLGAIGTIYADKINKYSNLRILVDEQRLKKYTNNLTLFNGKVLNLDYILPSDENFKADLIIIAVKYDGLKDVVSNIRNFVTEDTIILSLLNGVTSEDIIASEYGVKNILPAYFIGHSAVRIGRNITQDGVNKIVFGATYQNKNVAILKNYFEKVGINYEIPEDIMRSMWLKFMLNVSANQTTAVMKLTFGELINNPKAMEFVLNVMREVQTIAKAHGINNTETMVDEAIASLKKMSPEGKTSMLQDVEAGRKTEVDIFASVIIELGKKYNIPTPYNKILKELIEIY